MNISLFLLLINSIIKNFKNINFRSKEKIEEKLIILYEYEKRFKNCMHK